MTRKPLRYWLLIQPFLWTLLLISIWPLERIQQTDLPRTNVEAAQGSDAAQGTQTAPRSQNENGIPKQRTLLFSDGQNPELLLFLIVIAGGALGSSIFAARSYAGHVAAGDFDDNFIEWYFFRLPVGIGMALAIYVVLRGGLIAGSFANQSAAVDTVNPYGFAAIAVLAGMFSKRAAEKLKEIFDNIFKTDETPDSANLAHPSPKISNLDKNTIKAKSTGDSLKLTVSGQHFDKAAKVRANGKPRTTSYVSANQLRATLKPVDVASAGRIDITVVNSKKAGGAESQPLAVTVVA